MRSNHGYLGQRVAATVFLLTMLSARAQAESLEWTRQLGTTSLDWSLGVSADGLGSVYIAGFTQGSLGGPSAGGEDAFVSKYDGAGTMQWTRQFGSASNEIGYGVSADALGNVFTSGRTNGSVGGQNSAGGFDAFVSKFNASGTLQWTRQLGTSSGDESYGVSADGLGNVYISGMTFGSLGGPNAGSEDAFVSKYDSAGTLQWTRQLGTNATDVSQGVSADGLGNVYISGFTEGSLAGPSDGSFDAFVGKYDAAGNLLWTRQLGTSSSDASRAVSADGFGNVYISGDTSGDLGGPHAGNDAFVSKYDSAGTLLWTRQLGTSSTDGSNGVSSDPLGGVYIAGFTSGSLGEPNAGSRDTFVSKYDSAGAFYWTRQLGTSEFQQSLGVSADRLGNVYFTGETEGSLGGPNIGTTDAFVAKVSEVPEPGCCDLLILVASIWTLCCYGRCAL